MAAAASGAPFGAEEPPQAEGGLHGGPPPEGAQYIFAFGSLISNPGFDYDDRVLPCFVRGWRRVFWQGSTDHRGVPGAPGRVATLAPCEGAVTWGAAYRVAGDVEQRRRTMAYLEWREKQYDLRAQVPIYTAASGDQPHLTALTYIATSDRAKNPNYLGPAPLEAIAAQIASARGPSGPNHEYLFRLTDAVRRMGVPDEELFQLEALVRARLQPEGGDGGEEAAGKVERAGSEAAEEQRSEGTDVCLTSSSS